MLNFSILKMSSPSSSTRRLSSLYIASLGTVAFLALLGQAIVQSMLAQQKQNAAESRWL